MGDLQVILSSFLPDPDLDAGPENTPNPKISAA